MKNNFYKIMAVAILLIILIIGCEKSNITGITLDKANITFISIGETATLTATVHPEDATDKTVSWTSSNSVVATVTNGIVTAKAMGTAIITATTADGNYTATCAIVVTSVVVINGVTWATRNVDRPGTFAAKPEDAGMFYQWNRRVGWSATDPMKNSDDGTAWDQFYPKGEVWENTNNPCPPGWRVPTHDELVGLMGIGDGEWTTRNGVSGRIFGSDEEILFFPAAGFRRGSGGNLERAGQQGAYWSSTTGITGNAAYSRFFTDTDVSSISSLRIEGRSVRCVAE